MTSTKKLLTVLPILLLTGCPKNQPTTHSRQLGEACDSINQCLSGLYCEDGICRVVCTNDTQCDENASCVGGRCVIKAPNNCPAGFTGDLCDQCLPGFWGKECQECNCSKHGKCNDGLAGDGSCTCDKGWDGPNCDQCADGYATEECVPTTCKNGTANSSLTGKGLCSKCFDKWTGDDCNVCPVGYYDGLNNCVDCRKGTTGSSFGTDKCTSTASMCTLAPSTQTRATSTSVIQFVVSRMKPWPNSGCRRRVRQIKAHSADYTTVTKY